MEEERIRVLKLGKLKPLSQGDPILTRGRWRFPLPETSRFKQYSQNTVPGVLNSGLTQIMTFFYLFLVRRCRQWEMKQMSLVSQLLLVTAGFKGRLRCRSQHSLCSTPHCPQQTQKLFSDAPSLGGEPTCRQKGRRANSAPFCLPFTSQELTTLQNSCDPLLPRSHSKPLSLLLG